MTDTPSDSATPLPATGNPAGRRRALLILGVVVLIGVIVWAVFHFLLAKLEQETDDAYVAGDVVSITARDPGTVNAIHADNTQMVKAGQPLIDLDPATSDVGLSAAEPQLAQSRNSVAGTTVANNPAVLSAIAAYRRAAITRNHMHVVAPIDGVVAQRAVQLGQQVAAGMPLMAVVPLDRVWVDANFRETQLKDLRVGQRATITADMYGDDIVYHGHVAGLGAGSGNAFALLPPQNASGNWIKIVQRVPVRIALDPRELRANPLRVGLSVDATVDTADVSGRRIGQPARRAFEQKSSDADDRAVEAKIASNFARIVAGSFAALMITTTWDRREALHRSRLSEAVGTGMPLTMAREALGRMGLTDAQAAGAIAREMVGQAYLLALTDVFRLSAWLCAALIAIVWVTSRPAAMQGHVAAD